MSTDYFAHKFCPVEDYYDPLRLDGDQVELARQAERDRLFEDGADRLDYEEYLKDQAVANTVGVTIEYTTDDDIPF